FVRRRRFGTADASAQSAPNPHTWPAQSHEPRQTSRRRGARILLENQCFSWCQARCAASRRSWHSVCLGGKRRLRAGANGDAHRATGPPFLEVLPMVQKILVPVDGSTFAEHALPLALSVARRANATVHIAYVHAPVLPCYDGEVVADVDIDAYRR